MSYKPQDSLKTSRIHRGWYAAATIVVLAIAAMEFPHHTLPAPANAPPSATTPVPEDAAPLTPPAPVPTHVPFVMAPTDLPEDDDVIIDSSVYEAEQEEKYADPYEINEVLLMPDETDRVHPGYDDIVTAAEDEPDEPEEKEGVESEADTMTPP
jgi:hypothetical protein